MKEIVAQFVATESNRTSLITVTRLSLSDHGDQATIFISVMPENQESAAMDFLTRNLSELRRSVMDKIPNGKIPYFSFAIDKGEKLSRKIEELKQS